MEIEMSKNKTDRDSKHSTDTDKKRKSKNALIHGLYSSDVVMPWESREDFENLLADLRAEFKPDGAMEQDTVVDLACLRWQKQRVRKMSQAATYSDPFAVDLIQSGKKSWSGIRRHLRREAKGFRTMIDSLHDMYMRLADQANKVGDGLSAKERENVDVERARREIEGILSTMTQHVLPLIRDLQSGPNAERTLGKAYSPEYLEPILRIEAMIDARIDKALGRLASLKAFKSFEAHKPAMLPPPPHGQREIELQPMRK
jgi:hypothetical protein